MGRHAKTVHVTISNDLAEMAKVADLVDRFGTLHGLPENAVNAVNLALDELLNNTITHGYPRGGRHQIRLVLRADPEGLVAEIDDDGVAFDPVAAPRSRPAGDLRERVPGGVGLLFVRSLVDELTYQRRAGRNCLRLRKRLTGKN